MPTLRDIKQRIVSVQSTRQITRTMEMVATAKIRRAQERIENTRPYTYALADVLGNVVSHVPDLRHPLLEEHAERRRVVLVALTSDRGLAGAFNTNIIRMAETAIAEEADAGVETELITVGKKALTYFRYRGVEPDLALRDMTDRPDFSHAREIADKLIERYTAGEIDGVYIMFNRFKSVAEQVPERHQLLPIEYSVLHGAEEAVQGRGMNLEYIFEPSAADVLSDLLPYYVEAQVYRGLLESAASEQGARRTAMKSATDNASDMITTLTRSYNRARQAAITTEISEIVGGAAALEEE
jgi:F-type H+-transporting ATPase subunit gamma